MGRSVGRVAVFNNESARGSPVFEAKLCTEESMAISTEAKSVVLDQTIRILHKECRLNRSEEY